MATNVTIDSDMHERDHAKMSNVIFTEKNLQNKFI